MAQSTATRIDELLEFCFWKDEAVREFLAKHPELVDILLEARPHIELQFGRVRVELSFPLGDWGEGDLYAAIMSPFDADQTHDRFDRFWDEWWRDASGRRESFPLYIGIDFTSEPAP